MSGIADEPEAEENTLMREEHYKCVECSASIDHRMQSMFGVHSSHCSACFNPKFEYKDYIKSPSKSSIFKN